MKRIFVVIVIFLFMMPVSISYGANEWRKGTGEDVILGGELINDIDKVSFENIVDPIDRVLANYIQGATLVYNTGVTIDISAGSAVCSNVAGTARKMRINTSSVSATFAGNLDAGAEASSTTYTIWGNCDADAETFTVKISASSTAPTGVTSYAKLGSFFNDSSSDIDRTKIYTVPYGNVRADVTGRGLITDVRDFGTSNSSYTAKIGADLKIVFGSTGSIAANGGTFSITNLPFSSASTYRMFATQTDTGTAGVGRITQSSGSAAVITNASVTSGTNVVHTFNWYGIGY